MGFFLGGVLFLFLICRSVQDDWHDRLYDGVVQLIGTPD